MMSKQITETDMFMDLPLSSQALYLHLIMNADDDGFLGNSKTILRMVGASNDDFKLLVAKQFIIVFDDGITVIKDWRIHNYIQKDRYHSTMYSEHKQQLTVNKNQSYQRVNHMDTERIQNVSEVDTQVRLGKDRLGKDNKNNSPHSDKPKYGPDDRPYQIAQHLLGKIRDNNPDFKQPNLQHWANDIRLAHDRDKRDYDKLDNMVDWCQNDDFWQANILSGKKLRDKYDRLAAEANRKFKANKQVRTKETLPDWATEQAPTATKKKLTPEQQAALKQRMAKLDQRNSEREEETT